MPAARLVPTLCALFLSAAAFAQGPRGGPIKAGMVIDADYMAAPGEYALATDSLDSPAIMVRGEGITVDLTGVRLVGSDDPTRPDLFTGLAVRVEGNDVTIKGLEARGYKVALMARDVDGLTIDGCDFSYNWRQRLKSDPWKEDAADWMSYHNNEQDQWLRFGAALYLRECNGFAVHGNTVVGGHNALMLTKCNAVNAVNRATLPYGVSHYASFANAPSQPELLSETWIQVLSRPLRLQNFLVNKSISKKQAQSKCISYTRTLQRTAIYDRG